MLCLGRLTYAQVQQSTTRALIIEYQALAARWIHHQVFSGSACANYVLQLFMCLVGTSIPGMYMARVR